MADIIALPTQSVSFVDARGGGRWMRVTWHHEADVVVLSLWHDEQCVSSFRLDRDAVPAFVNALVVGLSSVQPATTRSTVG